MNTDNTIILKNVTIGYQGKTLLSNINFSLKKGDFAVLLGRNGSGKTTLFKTILRIISPLQGSIDYGKVHAPKFGYVPQTQTLDAIYPFTAEDVVFMGTFGQLKPFSFTKKATRMWVEQCLKDVGMYETRKHLFSQLSGGQQQRILIARALATRPNLLLLDEPITGIDVMAQKMIIELISSLHEKHQLTFLMVTHEIYNLPERVNKCIFIRDGRVIVGNRSDFQSYDKSEPF